MQDTWKDSLNLVKLINEEWAKSQEVYAKFIEARNKAAEHMDELLKAMVEEANKVFGTTKVRPEPVIEKGVMTGLKLWINDNCHAFKI